MGRKRHTKPTEQVNIHISIDAYEIIEGYRNGRLHEPRYRTLDRILGEYVQYRELIHNLREEIEEKDYVIQDLKQSLESRRKELEVINSKNIN
jgi:hypothetical protein